MENQKIIFRDKKGEASFLQSLQEAKDRCNELITVFTEFQPWQKIETLNDWINLITDPEGFYDRVLLENISLNVPALGKAKPNVEKLAELFDVPREAYMNIIRGIRLNESNCVPCRKKTVRIRTAVPAISLFEYQKYSGLLRFDAGSFIVDEDERREHLKSFNKYPESEAELERYEYWHNLADYLNSHLSDGRNNFNWEKLEKACALFGLLYSDGTAYVDDQEVYYEIQRARR